MSSKCRARSCWSSAPAGEATAGALAPSLAAILQEHPEVTHLKIEDGPGRPLGRSFHVKLWPTLILLRAGQVLQRLVRPSAAEVRRAFAGLS